MKTRLRRRGRLRAALLAVMICTTGTAYAATTPGAQTSSGGVTMAANSKKIVRYGARLRLSGRVAAQTADGRIKLEHAPRGQDWRPVAETSVGADGSWRFTVRPRESGAWRAVSSAGASRPREIAVAARVRAAARKHVRRGARVPVRGRVLPGVAGRTVRVQLRLRGAWRTVARARTRAGGRFRASFAARRPGSFRLRARFAGDRRNAAASGSARVRVYRPGLASWYGPGFYGGRTACGQRLSASILGVANKTLPCGTKVTFRYRGRSVTARVIDRGPYAGGREWDLAPAVKRALGFPSTGTVWSTR